MMPRVMRTRTLRSTKRKRNNVASLFGAAIPIPHVNSAVVDTLESLLIDARDGRISGIIYGIYILDSRLTYKAYIQ